jgi:molybdate transport system substrate-binding protein
VQDRLARAENVRAALAFVARGEAPLGIVYASDAAAEASVAVVARIAPELHPPIVYPAAVVAASTNPAAATFLAFLASPAARPVFERHGFAVLAGAS